MLRALANLLRRRQFATDELLELTNALIEANTTSDANVKAHFDFIAKKYGRLDKIPYDPGMKLVELVQMSKQSEASKPDS